MFDLFSYGFVLRGLEAGLIVGSIAPLIGIFLVLKRYSLIADTLSHVSLAGVAIGLLLKINPLITAIIAAVVSSVLIEKLRMSKKIYGESALSLFLSGSLALAIVLISFSGGFRVDLFNYLFGSLVTVKQSDVTIIASLGAVVVLFVIVFYKEFIYTTFDEEGARVSGIPTNVLNTLFIMLTAVTIALAIPIVGVLLIAALIVIPVISALQYRTNFLTTILVAECYSLFSVFAGIIMSFYLDLSTGGTIVLIAISLFVLTLLGKRVMRRIGTSV